jgi:hypothetical protein
MTYRKIAAFPFVWSALFFVVILLVPFEARGPYFRVEAEASKTLAALGCFVAAYTFERGDYMRRAWSYNGWCYLLLLVRDVTMAFFPTGSLVFGLVHIEGVQGTIAFIANGSSVWGTFLLARAWSIAGLEFPGSRLARLAVLVVAAAFALGVSGTDLVVDARDLLAGNLGSLHGVASDFGDIFGLCLLAPMILTAVAMSGGVLKWPWGLLTASIIFWLFYDAAATLSHLFPGHDVGERLAKETFRVLACACECAAGLAQRRVVTEPIDSEATEPE